MCSAMDRPRPVCAFQDRPYERRQAIESDPFSRLGMLGMGSYTTGLVVLEARVFGGGIF
jgi:hypothetical protein